MDSKSLATYFLFVLIAASLLLAVQILMPFLAPLVLAAAFAVVLRPLHQWLHRKLDGHDDLAALAVLLVVAICILVPLFFIATQIGWELAKLYGSIVDGTFSQNVSAILHRIQTSLPPDMLGRDYTDALAGNLSSYTRDALAWITNHITDAFSSIAGVLLNLFIFFVALFFFLRDGDVLKRNIIKLSPLKDGDDNVIFKHLGISINSVIKGNLLIALIRGIAAAIGFYFFGIPNPVLWGIVAGLAGLIPGIGIILVFAPAILYAYILVGWIQGTLLLLWGIFIVGLIDNALAPRFVGSGMQLHPLFVLLGIFGGIEYFGPVGLFLGPLSFSLIYALLSIYSSPEK